MAHSEELPQTSSSREQAKQLGSSSNLLGDPARSHQLTDRTPKYHLWSNRRLSDAETFSQRERWLQQPITTEKGQFSIQHHWIFDSPLAIRSLKGIADRVTGKGSRWSPKARMSSRCTAQVTVLMRQAEVSPAKSTLYRKTMWKFPSQLYRPKSPNRSNLVIPRVREKTGSAELSTSRDTQFPMIWVRVVSCVRGSMLLKSGEL